MSKRILVPVAHGSEEMETVIIVDTLVRAGFQVTMAAVGDKLQVQGSRGVWLTAEQTLEACSQKRLMHWHCRRCGRSASVCR